MASDGYVLHARILHHPKSFPLTQSVNPLCTTLQPQPTQHLDIHISGNRTRVDHHTFSVTTMSGELRSDSSNMPTEPISLSSNNDDVPRRGQHNLPTSNSDDTHRATPSLSSNNEDICGNVPRNLLSSDQIDMPSLTHVSLSSNNEVRYTSNPLSSNNEEVYRPAPPLSSDSDVAHKPIPSLSSNSRDLYIRQLALNNADAGKPAPPNPLLQNNADLQNPKLAARDGKKALVVSIANQHTFSS